MTKTSSFTPKLLRALAITLIALPTLAFAQLDLGFNYQAILRDTQGEPLVSQNISLGFLIHESSVLGPIVLSDYHSTSTNEHGLVSAVIGMGNAAPGALNNLNFHTTAYYLEVRVDGNSIGTQKLEAVPSALKATNMKLKDLVDVGASSPNIGQVLQWNGSSWGSATLSGGGSGPWYNSGSNIYFNSGRAGIGTASPANRLHLHEPTVSPSALQITNSNTGTLATDGLQLRVQADGSAQLMQNENTSLALGTNAQTRMTFLANGKVGMNTTTTVGASDLTLRSLNTGFGGMYVETMDATSGLPFYGYATNGSPKAWHYFSETTDQWLLSVGGNNLLAADATKANVGIGTVTPHASAVLDLGGTNKGFLMPRMTTAQRTGIASPAQALLVYDLTLNQTMQYNGSSWQALGAGGSGSSPWTSGTFGIEYATANVGVGGAASPFSRMDITSGVSVPFALTVNNSYTGNLNTHGISVSVGSNGTGTRYGVRSVVSAPATGTNAAYGVYGQASASSASTIYGVYGLASVTNGGMGYGVYGRANGAGNVGIHGYAADPNGYAATFDGRVAFNGRVALNGIGSRFTVNEELTIHASAYNSAVLMEMRNSSAISAIRMHAEGVSGGGGQIWVANHAGATRIALNVGQNGVGRVITDELQIRGGSDLAEYFEAAEDVEAISPGSIVVLDSDHLGKVKTCDQAYDRRVIGIVSGANGIRSGMMMGQEDSEATGNTPVAIAGRVYVHSDATNGAIQPGDMLCPSPTAGAAMKVLDWDKARGSIIGKALTSPDANGFVLVLVNLQ